ncbi:hypothetical protein VE04_08446 [Pseudogymnoascus sp. 24MN13]|nr:hypothetical protein VE04_08446 [Pseudogymnoascus sp. 24MN13]
MAGHVLASVQEATISISSDNSTNQVSWQTAFFGLVPLALNAMTQPSSLDFNLPESSLLFAARSSPFICVADALEVLISLCFYIYQEGSIYEAARLVNWRIARARLGSGVLELEASAVEKHPKTFIFLFLATLLPAVKYLGMQGLHWTKVWAGIYICSYVVLAIVRALAPKGWRKWPPQIAPLAKLHVEFLRNVNGSSDEFDDTGK